MTYHDFLSAYHSGRIRVQIDTVAAGKYLSARLLLPVFILPIIGLGAALMLWGFIWAGIAMGVAGIVLRYLVKLSAPNFVLTRALESEDAYREATQFNILKIVVVGE